MAVTKPVVGNGMAFAAAQRALGIRFDPHDAGYFHLEIQGIVAGGFSEISGMTIETDVETIREGGVNDYEHTFPKNTRYTNLVLKKGVTDMDLLWLWYQGVVEGQIERRNMTLYMLDQRSLPIMWWDVLRAYPIKWDGPTFDANTNAVGFQQLTLAYEKINRGLLSLAAAGARGGYENVKKFI